MIQNLCWRLQRTAKIQRFELSTSCQTCPLTFPLVCGLLLDYAVYAYPSKVSHMRTRLLIGLLISVMLHAFDELAIATALPLIVEDLGGYSLYGAAFSAYMLANIISMVWAGTEMARVGPAKPFVIGLVFFTLGLIVAFVAPNMPVLVIARAIQGLGGGIFGAIVFASINKAYDESERPRVFAYLSAAWVVPALAAPAAAGAIAEYLNWRLIFVGLLPFVAITAYLAIGGLRHLGAGGGTETGWSRTWDAVRIAGGAGVILAALAGSLSLLTILAIGFGVVIVIAPIKRAVPPGEGPTLAHLKASLFIKLLLMFGFFGAEAFLPLLLIQKHGLSAFQAGLVMTVAALSWTSAAFLHARLANKISPAHLTSVASLFILGGTIMLFPVLQDRAWIWLAFIAWTVSGAGMGLAYNTLSTNAMNNTIPGREGVTSTASGISEAIGFALAAGFGGAILNLGTRLEWDLSISIGVIWAMCLIAIVAAILMSVVTMDRSVPVPETVPE